jgi:aldose 1-epimerase
VTFRVHTGPTADRPERTEVWLLESDTERAEIAPALGFNCFRWAPRGTDVLHADPQFLTAGSSPTRSGVPILFPFPNRIRDGRFSWDAKAYELPRNDPSGKNAIHGFACRRAWRVIGQGEDADSAWLSGEFHGARDAPDCAAFWPADYRIRITYRLSRGRLRIEAVADNPDRVSVPFGLGYHPYFLTAPAAECGVQVAARQYWELAESLPSGRRLPVSGSRDLNRPRPFADLSVDDVLTDLPGAPAADGLIERGLIERGPLSVRIRSSPDFRETVIFTPPHRQAFCIEPYTCTTDAINLLARGVDAGLRVLQPGESWSGVVEFAVGGGVS